MLLSCSGGSEANQEIMKLLRYVSSVQRKTVLASNRRDFITLVLFSSLSAFHCCIGEDLLDF